jgi:hypothetical protein
MKHLQIISHDYFYESLNSFQQNYKTDKLIFQKFYPET